MDALLVDDDVELASVLTEYLKGHSVRLRHAASGAAARERMKSGERFDVLLLDVMLPGEDGFQLLPEFAKAAPVIMLTARGESEDRVRGLELGARDYLPKPFNPRELLLRMRAISGRATTELRVGMLELLPARQEARMGGTPLTLTSFEYRLLEVLMRAAGEPVTREHLAETLGLGPDYDPAVDRSLDVHVSNLRQKLERASNIKWIRTLRGVGYMLVRPT